MPIKIEIIADNAGDALDDLRALSEALLGSTSLDQPQLSATELSRIHAADAHKDVVAATEKTPVSSTMAETSEAVRERGKPSGGRSRRTKEEIAEDEAADAAEAAGGTQNIQNGEERTNPADAPETAAKDKADEKADPVNASINEATPDALRAVMGEYAQLYSMAAVTEDGQKIFVAALGAAPDAGVWKVSTIPADKLATAIKVWEEAAAKNPYKREVVAK